MSQITHLNSHLNINLCFCYSLYTQNGRKVIVIYSRLRVLCDSAVPNSYWDCSVPGHRLDIYHLLRNLLFPVLAFVLHEAVTNPKILFEHPVK